MSSKNIIVTEGRARKAVEDTIKQAVIPEINGTVNKAVANERIRTGIITKFYPYLDKAEVKLDYNNKKILCKILHRYGGDMIDFYTPLEHEQTFDETLREPCILPRATHHVCVLQIHDYDSDENLILGYYQNKDIVGFNPAKPGNVKFMSLGEVNSYWIKFGIDGLDFRLPSAPKVEAGELDSEMEEVIYPDSSEVYLKEEVYNKEEVDELIDGGGHGTHAVGSFTINENGHLIVQIPDGMSNPYSIDNSGHLIYDTGATNNGGS